jgi:uncharacterized membrane protein
MSMTSMTARRWVRYIGRLFIGLGISVLVVALLIGYYLGQVQMWGLIAIPLLIVGVFSFLLSHQQPKPANLVE